LRGRGPRAGGLVVALALATGAPSTPASAQLSEPCEAACGLVLAATGFTVATGAVVAYGRSKGGISTTAEGLRVWGVGFAMVVGGGIALRGNGERQERAVYAAGIGTLVGSVAGLGVEAAFGEGDGAARVAAALVGAAVGGLVGGVYGALTHEHGEGSAQATLVRLSTPF
jgi:hypothetical protein